MSESTKKSSFDRGKVIFFVLFLGVAVILSIILYGWNKGVEILSDYERQVKAEQAPKPFSYLGNDIPKDIPY